ncbi:MAG: DUF29 domain-containing protein [Crocosphaera sp.]|jgi:hypothetical protein
MKAETHPLPSSLYELDYFFWLEETVKQLRQGKFSLVDLENLIEEIESMGRSERRAVESLLINILVHVFKLAYWELERARNANHWIMEIATFRVQIKRILANSPSLKPYVNKIFESCYEDARKIVTRKKIIDPSLIPLTPFLTIEQALDEDWFPKA